MLQETLNMYTKVGGMEVSEMQKERQDKKKGSNITNNTLCPTFILQLGHGVKSSMRS